MSKKKRKKNHKSNIPQISLVMIVKDEEKFLPGCLESVRNFVDEMIVVDTGSTDRTIEIARSFGAKVFSFEWQYDFSKARNFALEKATGPWILWLDADERLPEKYQPGLKKIIASGRYDALVMKLRSEVNGPLGKTPHYQQSPRIFKKLPGVQFEYPVHEQITPSLIRAGARFVMVDVIIEHLGYAQEEAVIEQKIQRNLKLLRKHLEMEPDNAYAHYQMAQSLELLDKVDEALEHYHLAIQHDEKGTGITPTVYLHLAAIEIRKNNYEKAIELAAKSYDITRQQFTAPYILAEIYFFLKEYDQAIEYYQQVLEYLAIPIANRKLVILIEKEVDLRAIYKKFVSALYLAKRFDELEKTIQKMILEKIPFSLQLSEVLSKVLSRIPSSAQFWEQVVQLLNWDESVEKEEVLYPFMLFEKWFEYPSFRIAFRKKLQEKEYSADLYFKAAEIFFNRGQLKDAYWCINKACEQSDHELMWQLKGMCELKLGMFPQALTTYEKLSENYPSNLSYLKILGGLYAKTGNLEAASRIVQRIM
jgi:glycosyltransferase involved in cell wall biosynthesis